ncbi:Protein C09E7.4 [Aphelenchoides avenae]|nr:Protein C09E7.4 [Aphelenchus avenae]
MCSPFDDFPEDFMDDTNDTGESEGSQMQLDPDDDLEEGAVDVDTAPDSGLPQKAAEDLAKSEIAKIIKAESRTGRNYLFAVNKKDSCYVYLYYSAAGDKDAAIAGKAAQFVRCTVCQDLMQARGGHLSRHSKKHEGTSRTSTPISTTSSITSYMPEVLTNAEKSQISALLANYAIDSGAPFRALESDPIHRLVVELINFGVKRKRPVDLSSVLPCRVTIASHCKSIASSRINKAEQLLEPFKEHGGAISLDYGHRVGDYLAVVAHFVEPAADGWKLRALPIGFDGSDIKSKEAEQIWFHLLDAIETVGLKEEDMRGVFCVTDEGKNVLAMSRDQFHPVRCIAHVLNTIGNRAFDLYKSIRQNGSLTEREMQLIDNAKEVLDTAQVIANNIRGMQKVVTKIGFKPTRGADTRWLSVLNVCIDIRRCLDTLIQMKQDPAWASRMGKVVVDAITKINGLRNELDVCISVLAEFEEPAENVPTIHLVWKHVLKLRKSMSDAMAPTAGSSEMKRALAKSVLLASDRKLEEGLITDAHRVATFLNPRLRHLRHLTEEEKKKVHDKVRNEMHRWGPPATQLNDSNVDFQSSAADTLEEIPDKRPEADELDTYVNGYFAETTSNSFDILEFWAGRENQFPSLAAVAMKYLAIPASSAACERAFRRLKLLITDSRESLKPQTVSRLMIAKHY